MTRVVDVWRAVDPDARLVSGAPERLTQPLRGVLRTRSSPPHLPSRVEGELLVVDAALVVSGLDQLLAALAAADLRPAAILAGGLAGLRPEPAAAALPVLASDRSSVLLADAARSYLADETAALAALERELRLATAEASLADPDPTTAVALVAARLRRGVAVVVDGALHSLIPRPAGRALAASFAAAHGRGLTAGTRSAASRRTRDGLWLLERQVRAHASVWLFDDLPFAAVDEVAAEALAVTLRALLRRPPATGHGPRRGSAPKAPVAGEDRLRATLLAVAEANGRVAPAARALGVHRNTVLYRLRQAKASLGIDPRRPEDALRLLAEARGERTREP